MDKIKYYYETAQLLRNVLQYYSSEAAENNTAVDENFYAIQEDLKKVIRNYRAYCRRHGLEYTNYDI